MSNHIDKGQAGSELVDSGIVTKIRAISSRRIELVQEAASKMFDFNTPEYRQLVADLRGVHMREVDRAIAASVATGSKTENKHTKARIAREIGMENQSSGPTPVLASTPVPAPSVPNDEHQSDRIESRRSVPIPTVERNIGMLYPERDYQLVSYIELQQQRVQADYYKSLSDACIHTIYEKYTEFMVQDYLKTIELAVCMSVKRIDDKLKKDASENKLSDQNSSVIEGVNRFMTMRSLLLGTIVGNVIDCFMHLQDLQQTALDNQKSEVGGETIEELETKIQRFGFTSIGLETLLYCLCMIICGCEIKAKRFEIQDDPDVKVSMDSIKPPKRVFAKAWFKKFCQKHLFITQKTGEVVSPETAGEACPICLSDFKLDRKKEVRNQKRKTIQVDDRWPSLVSIQRNYADASREESPEAFALIPLCGVCTSGLVAFNNLYHSVWYGMKQVREQLNQPTDGAKSAPSLREILDCVRSPSMTLDVQELLTYDTRILRACYAPFLTRIVQDRCIEPLRTLMGDIFKPDDPRRKKIPEIILKYQDPRGDSNVFLYKRIKLNLLDDPTSSRYEKLDSVVEKFQHAITAVKRAQYPTKDTHDWRIFVCRGSHFIFSCFDAMGKINNRVADIVCAVGSKRDREENQKDTPDNTDGNDGDVGNDDTASYPAKKKRIENQMKKVILGQKKKKEVVVM